MAYDGWSIRTNCPAPLNRTLLSIPLLLLNMNGLMEFKSGREIGETVAGEWEKMVLRLWRGRTGAVAMEGGGLIRVTV
jgi:hypothetical protein